MKRTIIALISTCLSTSFLLAQTVQQQQIDAHSGYGYVVSPTTSCLSSEQREAIQLQLNHNIDSLVSIGILPRKSAQNTVNARIITTLNWPLRAANGLNYLDYYSISNYLDKNSGTGLLDYNCGTHTYEGHRGTDIFTWPYPFLKMDNNQVEIIAAAAGTIISKIDGNFDRSCTNNSNQWNAVYVQHADGSIAWYGHMKNGSLTTKSVGQTVAAGEFLGVLGSSGNSTGPHLHLELYDASNNLVDPWNGTCNGTTSWWANQRPYTNSKINRISTHGTTASVPDCETETPNEQTSFGCGSSIYLYSFYQDELRNQTSQNRLIKPDGSIYWQTTRTFTNADWYAASYWYYNLTLPANAPSGTWKYQIIYQGTTYETPFTVNCVVPIELTDFRAKRIADNRAQLTWETKTEHNAAFFNLQKSLDGTKWQTMERVKATGGNSETPQYYATFDAQLADGTNYYRLEQVDMDGTITYSKVVSVVFDKEPTRINLSPNPVGNGYLTIDIQNKEAQNDWTIDLLSIEGKLLERSKAACQGDCKTLIRFSELPYGVYFVKISNGKNSFLRKVVK